MRKEACLDLQSSPWHPFNSQKALVHAERFQAILDEQYLPPVVLNLDVSGRCQYACPHCHHRSKQVRERLPDLSERLASTLPAFLRSWEVKNARVLGCCIVGSAGDALLYPRLASLLRELHFIGVDVGLVTNGYALKKNLSLAAAHYCKFVGFSMDAGTADGYREVKQCPDGAWELVCAQITFLTRTLHECGLRNDTCWKMLVLPQTQHELYEGCRVARDLGCRYVQVRPADLPDDRRMQIDVALVEDQLRRAIRDFEIPDKFEIVGVRHKFSSEFKAVLPKYCWLTPLTVTITSDGKAYACVDRRCDATTLIANCAAGGWEALRRAWGGPEHLRIVHEVINCKGAGPQCGIRCSNYGYDALFRNFFTEDKTDRNLI